VRKAKEQMMDNNFDRAQADYDAMEPPEPTEGTDWVEIEATYLKTLEHEDEYAGMNRTWLRDFYDLQIGNQPEFGDYTLVAGDQVKCGQCRKVKRWTTVQVEYGGYSAMGPGEEEIVNGHIINMPGQYFFFICEDCREDY
jgi:hypothetical protein